MSPEMNNFASLNIEFHKYCPDQFIVFNDICFLLRMYVPEKRKLQYYTEYDSFMTYVLTEIGIRSLTFAFHAQEDGFIAVRLNESTGRLSKASVAGVLPYPTVYIVKRKKTDKILAK